MRVPAACLAVGLLLAGCFGGDAPDGPGTTTPEEPEDDNGVLHVTYESNGVSTVEIPFPALDSCRTPEDWMSGGPDVQGAVPEVRDVTGDRTGRVLALTAPAAGPVSFSAQIPLGPECQTLRYDPWSIDPDRDDGALEVRVTEGEVSSLSVVVRRVRDGCGEATLYDGTPGTAWTALERRMAPAGCPG
jgi:hypothetical protein